MKILVKLIKWSLIIVAILTVIWYTLAYFSPIQEPKAYGVTFAPRHAESFGEDPRVVLESIFADLGVRKIRLSAYWNISEMSPGNFDYSDIVWQLDLAEQYDAEVILGVGRKLPRWPECHIPEWAKKLDENQQNVALIKYINNTVEQLQDYDSIVMWQVENEPFLPFGECPKFDATFIDEEILEVQKLDDRPILVTASGELSFWVRALRRGDVFGTTMYRRIYNNTFGQIEYPLAPSFFRAKRTLASIFVDAKPMIVIELQGEPWLKESFSTVSVAEQYSSVSPEYFAGILDYASKTSFDTFYLWGVEWWHWLNNNGHPEIWNIMKTQIKHINNIQ